MVQPPNLESSIDEDFLDYVLEELIEQPHNSLIVSASLLLLLKLACNFQLFCLWVDLPSPAAAIPSPSATATATATTTSLPASPT
jgi:hypothetical protein